MFAVIQTGGKQYRVAQGDTLRVEKLSGEIGSQIVFDQVLLVGGEHLKVGTPFVKDAKVETTVLAQKRDTKIIVYKLRRRKNYRRKQGHRQWFTELKVTNITV